MNNNKRYDLEVVNKWSYKEFDVSEKKFAQDQKGLNFSSLENMVDNDNH